MGRKVTLGAPSLTGKDANDLVTEVFGDATFPLKVTITSLMPMPTVFPEVDVSLRSVAAPTGNSQTVTISNMDKFQRFASSLEQVAELNHFETAVTVEEVEDVAVATTSGKKSKKTVDAAASAADAGETTSETAVAS